MSEPAQPPAVEHPPPRERPARPRTVTPAVTVIVTLGVLLLTALLNADQLVQTAERLPFGSTRTASLRVAEFDRTVSHSLWLDRPRRTLDGWLGHHHNAPSPPRPAPPIAGSPTPTPTARPTPHRTSLPRPTAAHPLRVYIGGDSVAAQLADGFGVLIGKDEPIRLDDDARISTGLTRPDYFDWPGHLREVLSGDHPPQVVVVMFGGNDVQPIMTPHGPASPGSTAWLAEYRRRVAETMSLLSASRADVYWLGQPVMRSAEFNARIGELDDIFASEAATYPDVTFVDTRKTLADAHGHYTAYLPGADGHPVLVRASDGMHMTLGGALRVAAVLLTQLRRHWSLP